MRIALAADHAGFALKEKLLRRLAEAGHEVSDFGTHTDQSCDYPEFAEQVARAVADGRAERGIVVCMSGIAPAIAANKVRGVRAAPAENVDEVRLTREHNDANVLTLGARFTTEDRAVELIRVFLSTEFEGGRHARRVAQVAEIEKRN